MAPLLLTTMALVFAALTGTHMCPDELNLLLQAWAVVGQSLGQAIPIILHIHTSRS